VLKESSGATNKNISKKLKDFCLSKELKLSVDSKHINLLSECKNVVL
jgi:hypothetical protein